jgi:hypothetical protein
MSEARVPCVSCKTPILEGARKCRACKAWQIDAPPPARQPEPRLPACPHRTSRRCVAP